MNAEPAAGGVRPAVERDAADGDAERIPHGDLVKAGAAGNGEHAPHVQVNGVRFHRKEAAAGAVADGHRAANTDDPGQVNGVRAGEVGDVQVAADENAATEVDGVAGRAARGAVAAVDRERAGE